MPQAYNELLFMNNVRFIVSIVFSVCLFICFKCLLMNMKLNKIDILLYIPAIGISCGRMHQLSIFVALWFARFMQHAFCWLFTLICTYMTHICILLA